MANGGIVRASPGEDDPGSIYDVKYYQSHCGPVPYGRNDQWLSFFRAIAERVRAELSPKRVLDAGCAFGLLVESFRNCGIEAWGIDVSRYAISQVKADVRPYCHVGSLTDSIAGRFDLITCIEVLEHLSPSDARLAIERLTSATDTILFSSTPDDFEEPTHCNVQPIFAWVKLFSEWGFHPDILFDASFVAPHAFLLRRSETRTADDVLLLFTQKLQIQCELYGRNAELGQLRQSVEQLLVDFDATKKEIARIRLSPAWGLISRYRNWLRDHERRRSLIWRVYEPIARWGLRRTGLSHESATSDSIPATAERDKSSSYREWWLAAEPSEAELALQRESSRHLSHRPLISVLVPVYRVPLSVLQAMVESVAAQTYDNWELCIAHAEPVDSAARTYLNRLKDCEPRVKLKLLAKNLGISGNSNEALSLVTGPFVALLDHDDILAPFALFEVVRALNCNPDLDFIYSDRDQIDGPGLERQNPLFKPDWSPEILLSANYLTHLNVLRSDRVRAIGGWRPGTDGAQDWDLFLRYITKDSSVCHIPMVLYHWRMLDTSVGLRGFDAKPYAIEAQLVSLRDHLSRVGSSAVVEAAGDGYFRMRWGRDTRRRASIIVLQTSHIAHTLAFARRVLSQSNDALELIVACTESTMTSDPRLRFSRAGAHESVAARLNSAVEISRADVLIFVDENVEIQDKWWMSELVGPLENQAIGIVGVKLLDSQTGLIRHAGLAFGPDAALESVFCREPDHANGIFGSPDWFRNWLAVSGACFSIRRETFRQVGQFSVWPEYPRLDIDLCLRVRSHSGCRVLYNPFVNMLQSGTAALEQWLHPRTLQEGAEHIRRSFPEGDPYFNRNLICRTGRITLNKAPKSAWSERLVCPCD